MRFRKDKEREISRVFRSTDEARITYNRMSRFYDVLAGAGEKRLVQVGVQKLNVSEGEIVLEIGFGTGNCIVDFARSVGSSGKVFGIDISEGMKSRAEQKVKKASLTERVELTCGDALNLPYKAEFFDAVFSSFTLELFDTPEIPQVLLECNRVLSENGRICIVSMSRKGKIGLMVNVYEWLHRKFPRSVDCRPIYVEDAVRDAGFTIMDTTAATMWGLPAEIVLAGKQV